ncbi:MAG TPA: PD-(D/E)XK nuclease family protein [Terriglobales bacterium]|nr:PD-(D/E)XK nuclease family protein [Terriglobales bacterium]
MQPQVAAALAAGGTVLASHPRLARALAAEFDRHQREAGQQAWPRPAIWTLDQWLEQCWTAEGDRLLLSGAQEARLWESIIASGGHGRRMLHPGAAAAEAARAWRLAHDWELDWSSPAWNDTEDAQAFAVWAGEFRRHCRAEQWITAAELAGAAAGFAPPQGPVALAGFEERAPAQARRFAAWRNSGVPASEFGPPHPPAAPTLVMASDADDEFNRAAQWARGLMEQGARGPIGVVVPDLGPVRAAAERIFTAALHPDREPWSHAPRAFHLSLGVPLAFAPPVAAVLELLRAWEAPGPIPLPDVLAWLRSPYTAGAEVEAGARARLERILRRQGRMRWSWRDLQTQTRAGGAPAWATAVGAGRVVRAAWPARQSYQAWADAVAELARATGWPGNRSLGSEEQQAAQAWEALLLEFAQLDEVARGPIAFSDARRRVAGLAQRIFQPQAADAAVQILGWHDAVGAEFQHLWIAGMSEDAVPAAGAPHPFLPLALQRAAAMPRASAVLAAEQARRQWDRMLASAPSVFASCAAGNAAEPLRPSPFLSGLAAEAPAASMRAAAPAAVPAAALETLDDAQAPAANGEERTGSARTLEEQAACPFQAFAHQRLHARLADPLGVGLSTAERGTLLHAMLDVVWSQLQTQATLLNESEDALTAKAARWAETVVADFAPLLDRPGLAGIEAMRLARTALEWLRGIERTRDPFEVAAREKRVALAFGGLELSLRADRLDRSADGRLILLDYKSGKMDAHPWTEGAAAHPQLPLYAVTHPQRENIAAIAFAQVRTGEMKWISEPTPRECLARWEAELAALAGNYLRGDARVAPRNPRETCKNCDLSVLCRVREAGLGSEVEEANDGE